MHVISVTNVNQALPHGLRILATRGDQEPSRNGPVRVMPEPVVTKYAEPTQRVLFSPMRDANPFFHLFESLWMLAGRNDLPWLVQYNSKFAAYSDDGGKTQPAAYGHRWTNYFGYNQVQAVIAELTARPDSRRAVIGLWDSGSYHKVEHANADIRHMGSDSLRAITGSADIPCNTQVYFRIVHGALDMGITCRSNDIIWGAYGANSVHFSVLQEFIAAKLGVSVGMMYQFSWNFHYYEDIVKDPYAMAMDCEQTNLYGALHLIKPMPMFAEPDLFMNELPAFMNFAGPGGTLAMDHADPFLKGVAVPMVMSWRAHKARDYTLAQEWSYKVAAGDWRMACRQWMERRELKWKEKQS